jgi:hypothetical protein
MDYKLYNIKLISPVVEIKGRTSKPTSDHLTPLAPILTAGAGIEPARITVLPLNYSHPVAGGHPLSTTGEISFRFENASLKPLVRLALSELGFSSNFIRKWVGHVLVEGYPYAEGIATCQ